MRHIKPAHRLRCLNLNFHRILPLLSNLEIHLHLVISQSRMHMLRPIKHEDIMAEPPTKIPDLAESMPFLIIIES